MTLSCLDQSSFSRVLFFQLAQRQCGRICVDHIQLWAVAAYKLPYQTKVAIMLANIRPFVIKKILFGSQVLGFLRECCHELLMCHWVASKKSYAAFVRASFLYICDECARVLVVFWKASGPENWTLFSMITCWILIGMITTFVLDGILPAVTVHGWMWST